METALNYTDERMYLSTDERKLIRKINKLSQSHPGEVTIRKTPDQNDGCLYATLPASWFKIAPPRTMSEEERQRRSEHMRATRAAQQEDT